MIASGRERARLAADEAVLRGNILQAEADLREASGRAQSAEGRRALWSSVSLPLEVTQYKQA